MSARPRLLGSHMPALDGVRGLAIVMVLFVHFIGDQNPHGAAERLVVRAANYGSWGVGLFFVLSGFLITGILWDSKGDPHFFRNFYARRTLRIFPLYYATLAILFGLVPLVPALYPARLAQSVAHQAWVWPYGTNIYLSFRQAWALPYVGHFWSLAVEEHFYLLWPWIVFVSSRTTLVRVCFAAFGMSLVLRWILSAVTVNGIAQETLTPCCFDALCTGGALAVWARHEGLDRVAQLARPALRASGAAFAGLTMFHMAVPSLDDFVLPVRESAGAILFGALIVVILTADPETRFARFFTSRTMRFFGKYSYGLYVIHGILAFGLQDKQADAQWLAGRLGNHFAAMWAQAIVGSAVSLGLAVLSYEFFEKHMLRLKGRFAAARPDAAPRTDH